MMITQRPRRTREVTGPTPGSVAIRAKNPYERPPDWRTLERRDQEDNVKRIQELTRRAGLNELRSEWEKSTDKKIKLNIIKNRVDEAKQIVDVSVDDKREKLRDLLATEEEAFLAEMTIKEETMLERQAKMRDRAKSMKDKREAERLKFVQQKYDQQFREQCEELRSTITKRTQDQVCLERMEQLNIKEQVEAENRAQDKMWADMWEHDRLLKEKREEEEAKAAHERNMETVEILNTQRAALARKKEEEARLKEEEAKLLEEQQALRNFEEMQKQMAKEKKQKEMKDMLNMCLNMKLKRKAKEEQEQLAFDLKMLEQLLQETHNEAMEALQRKKELREEDQRYREYLKQLYDEEKRKEEELNKMVADEVEKMWQKRLEQWKREREARKQLLSDVIAGRAEQIREKLIKNEIEQLDAQREKEELIKLIAENQRLEILEAQKKLDLQKKYQESLQAQMALNERLRQHKKKEEMEEVEASNLAEMQYQEKMLDALSKPLDYKVHPMRRRLLDAQGIHY